MGLSQWLEAVAHMGEEMTIGAHQQAPPALNASTASSSLQHSVPSNATRDSSVKRKPSDKSSPRIRNRTSSLAASSFPKIPPLAERATKISIRPERYTCGCPHTCDRVALSQQRRNTRSCEDTISQWMRQTKRNETASCLRAVDESGVCGLECHPVHCHNATQLIPSPLDWSRVKNVVEAAPTSNASANGSGSTPPIPTFKRYDRVVVGTKVLGPNNIGQLMQMLCLFTAAYNRHVNYDIIVFTTLPWKDAHMAQVRAVVPNTVVHFALEGPPLEDQVAAMSVTERDDLYRRCNVNVTAGEKITWSHLCSDGPNKGLDSRLGYSWQAEFRSYHIWKMPILAQYKYMLWMDTDALCTRPWPVDPLQVMVENDLVLLFDNFPQGSVRNLLILDKLQRAYNRTACQIGLTPEGHLKTNPCKVANVTSVSLNLVHGFHHITNLDFYRNERNLNFARILVETHRFSRTWDDQIAVTLPAAMEAPERAWEYGRHGWIMGMYHNARMDGKGANVNAPPRIPGFHNYWQAVVQQEWDLGREMCDSLVAYSGR